MIKKTIIAVIVYVLIISSSESGYALRPQSASLSEGELALAKTQVNVQLPIFEFTTTTTPEDVLCYIRQILEQLLALQGKISNEQWLEVRTTTLERIARLHKSFDFLKHAVENGRMPCMHALNGGGCPDAILALQRGVFVTEIKESPEHVPVPQDQKPPISRIELNDLTRLIEVLDSIKQMLTIVQATDIFTKLRMALSTIQLPEAAGALGTQTFQDSTVATAIGSAA